MFTVSAVNLGSVRTYPISQNRFSGVSVTVITDDTKHWYKKLEGLQVNGRPAEVNPGQQGMLIVFSNHGDYNDIERAIKGKGYNGTLRESVTDDLAPSYPSY